VLRRLGQLYRLLGLHARAQLLLTAVVLVLERLVLAAGAIGITRGLHVAWGASAIVAGLWAVRGLLRQRVSSEAREKLTMTIAEGALAHGGQGSFLLGEEADAAVFEGRYAAEQVLVRHAPSLFAEPTSVVVLLCILRPTGLPVLVGGAGVAATALVLALLRKLTTARQRGAWRKHMIVAQGTLTSIRAATEVLASGHEQLHLARLRAATVEWTRAAARAERSAALFQRIPLASLALLGIVLLAQASPLELTSAIRLAVFFPPLAGLMRTVFELVRQAPRIQLLAPALDRQSTPIAPRSAVSPPELPCEIRFESISFAYDGAPVLDDISFRWKPNEILGIRGPNGSGKSTLLKLLLGLLDPSGGNIRIAGVLLRDVDLPAWRRCVAYLPQRPYLPDKATVFEAMRLTTPDLTAAQAQAALVQTGTWERLGRNAASDPLGIPMASLSVGARQRVLLSRVFTRHTAVVLLDEPDENLDTDTRAMLARIAESLRATHMVAIATHDETLLALADHVVDLDAPPLTTQAAAR
jgi:ABC-type multidrug transport system fused ATPase/permease subunit